MLQKTRIPVLALSVADIVLKPSGIVHKKVGNRRSGVVYGLRNDSLN